MNMKRKDYRNIRTKVTPKGKNIKDFIFHRKNNGNIQKAMSFYGIDNLSKGKLSSIKSIEVLNRQPFKTTRKRTGISLLARMLKQSGIKALIELSKDL